LPCANIQLMLTHCGWHFFVNGFSFTNARESVLK
jgi:hypothetical protein